MDFYFILKYAKQFCKSNYKQFIILLRYKLHTLYNLLRLIIKCLPLVKEHEKNIKKIQLKSKIRSKLNFISN